MSVQRKPVIGHFLTSFIAFLDIVVFANVVVLVQAKIE